MPLSTGRKFIGRSLAIIIALGVLLVVLPNLSRQHRWVIPRPNSFDALEQAARMLNGPAPRGVTNSFEQYVILNEPVLKLWREAIGKPLELPLFYYRPGSASAMTVLQNIQQLAWAAEIQGKLHEEKKRHGEAADVYLAITEMGISLQRGPLIALLFGVAIEKTGLNGLERIRSSLSADERRLYRERLAVVANTRPSMKEVKVREHYYFRQQVQNPIKSLITWIYLRKPMQSAEGKLDRIAAENRMVLVENDLEKGEIRRD